MAGINLLPWREAAKKKSQQQFVMSVVGAVAIGVLAVGAGYTYMDGRISYQEQRNAHIQAEIKRIDNTLEEIKTLDSLNVDIEESTQSIEASIQSVEAALSELDDL